MLRITLAPIAGVDGTAKAVKRPASHAEALEVAAAKEVLGKGVKPARLFFGDGGEVESDSWELVADKDFVFVSAGASAPLAQKAPGQPQLVPQPVAQPVAQMMMMPQTNYADQLAQSNAEALQRLAAVRPQGDKLALICIGLHIIGYCVGHLPFFVETMRSINDTAGNTAFVMFVFIPSTAIWVTGLMGGVLSYEPWSRGRGCGGCCTDYRGRPNMGCAQTCSLTAMCLHGIIAYIETFLVANLQSWVLGVLIAKNVLCIAGEIVGTSSACMLGRALKDPPPVAAGVAVPAAVAVTSATDAV